MNHTTKKQKGLHWSAAAFCAVLSAITLSSNLLISVVTHTNEGGWAIPFLCFLPVCFYFADANMSRMKVEINSLKQQVEELQTKQPV